VCGEARNGRDAVEKASLLKPEVMLVDISMPDLNGFEVASRIHQQLPERKNPTHGCLCRLCSRLSFEMSNV
jgi:YesN/AraC family two-component response regulator